MTTELGSKLHHAFKNAALAEAAYDATEGEETEDTEQAQALAELSTSEAIEAFAGGLQTVKYARETHRQEAERHAKAIARLDKIEQFYESKLRGLVALTGKPKAHAGTFTVSVWKPEHKCIVSEDARIPVYLLSITPEKTIEASSKPDKVKIKRWLKANPTKSIPGVTITDEPGKVVLS